MIKLKLEKVADRSYVFLGISNKIKYSVVITNIGDIKVNCVKIKDIVSLGARFVQGSFSINGCKQDVNCIDKYISVGSIKPGSNILVTYDVEVESCNPPKEIVNSAMVTYCDESGKVVEVASNEVKTPIIKISINMCKTVDKAKVKIGDVVSYSVFIRNNSNIPIDNIMFFDELPSSVQVLPSSVLINLKPQYIENFNGGIELGSLNAYSSIVISFQVQVINLPESSIIKNSGMISYNYTIYDANIPVTSNGQSCSNIVFTEVLNEKLSC